MYEQLVSLITQFYPQDQAKGLFLTCMNEGVIVGSAGTMMTNRPWPEVLSKLYKTLSQSSPITTIICDIVIQIEEVVDYSTLGSMSHKDVGLVLVSASGEQIGCLLPDTVGIQNLSQGLNFMKQKYQFQGMVSVFTIKTDRKVVTKTK